MSPAALACSARSSACLAVSRASPTSSAACLDLLLDGRAVRDDLGGLVAQRLVLFAGLLDGLFDLDLGVHGCFGLHPEQGLQIPDDALEHVPLLTRLAATSYAVRPTCGRPVPAACGRQRRRRARPRAAPLDDDVGGRCPDGRDAGVRGRPRGRDGSRSMPNDPDDDATTVRPGDHVAPVDTATDRRTAVATTHGTCGGESAEDDLEHRQSAHPESTVGARGLCRRHASPADVDHSGLGHLASLESLGAAATHAHVLVTCGGAQRRLGRTRSMGGIEEARCRERRVRAPGAGSDPR